MSPIPLNDDYASADDYGNRLVELFQSLRRPHGADHSPIGGLDPVRAWSAEGRKVGTLAVASNIFTPGIWVPWPCTLSSIVARVAVAPEGADLKIRVYLNGEYINDVSVLAQGGIYQQRLNLRRVLAAGDSLDVGITQVGSTVAGANLGVAFLADPQPGPLVRDTFTSGPFTYADSGQTWADVTTGGTWSNVVEGMTGTMRSLSSTANNVRVLNAGAFDLTAHVVLHTAGADPGIVFRYSDVSNYWYANKTSLVKRVAGVETVMATLTTPIGSGDSWTVVLTGSQVQVIRNEMESVALVTDSFNATATRLGLRANSDTVSRFESITADVT